MAVADPETRVVMLRAKSHQSVTAVGRRWSPVPRYLRTMRSRSRLRSPISAAEILDDDHWQ